MMDWFQPSSRREYMPHHFEARPKTIGDLFTGLDKPLLAVPPFQRGYSWEKKHVDAFWRDLTDFIDEKKAKTSSRYFFGPIVILEQEGKPSEILDGQQRLATATVLFACIRDAARKIGTEDLNKFAADIHSTFIERMDAGDSLGYTLTLGDLDKAFFQETVQKYMPDSTVKAKVTSHTLIKRAKHIIDTNIDGILSKTLSAKDKLLWLKDLRTAVRSDLVMTYIPVEEEREAFQIFETLNDRGLRLSVPDLLLNYLMKMAPASDRVAVRTNWDKMIEKMGQRKTSDFLRAVWVSEFGDLKKQDLFTSLKEYLKTQQAISVAYASQCAVQCETYIAFLDGDEKIVGPAAKHVKTILRPLACFSAMPLLLSARAAFDNSGLEKLCRWLVVFVVRFSVIAGMDSAVMETLFFSLAKEVREKMKPTPIQSGNRQQDCLNYIVAQLVRECPSDERIISAMQDVILSPRDATYIIGTLCNAMQSERRETAANQVNLEHIFPRNPLPSEWRAIDEMRPLLWSIGNLTMLGIKLNENAANRGYFSKRTIYRQSQLTMANNVSTHYTKWNAKSILNRSQRLGKEVVKVWNFKNPSHV